MKIPLFLFFLVSFCYSLSFNESKHLLNRTSFSYTKEDLNFFLKFSKKEAVLYLISQAKNTNTLNIPSNIKKTSLYVKNFKSLSQEEKKAMRKTKQKKIKDLQIWWYKMMLTPSFSLREKMTLFWHNHFTSSYKVVKNPYYMFLQNQLYRKHSLGSFEELLYASSKDLAMLIYLDNNSNKKSHANENYARELLELFTLGEGNYTELDVKEAARAFTGYRVIKRKNILKKIKKQHDDSSKIFLNQKGNFDAKDIIRILLQNEQTSYFIVSKLYKEFISSTINKSLVLALSKEFKKSNYDIFLLMQNLLLSEDFWNNKSTLIKSPAELSVSLYKNLGLSLKQNDYKYFLKINKSLGQELFNPPNVKGWEGNTSWINSSSYVLRKNFIKRVINKNVNNSVLSSLDLKSTSEFEQFFYSKYININYNFKNRKKDYKYLLNQDIYQLR